MLFVCYPKCTTCQRARRWLDDNLLAYSFRDIKTQNPTAEEIREWAGTSGLPPRRFFNTSGNAYKSLNLKEKLPGMSEDEQIALLSSDGMLVKRPILVSDDVVLVGFKEDEWESRLKR